MSYVHSIWMCFECALAFKKGTAFKGNVKLSSGMEFEDNHSNLM